LISPAETKSPRALRTCAQIILGAAILWLAGCATPTERPSRPTEPVREIPTPHEEAVGGPVEEIRIGVLLPLSGEYGQIGQSLLNAASFAVFDSGDKRLALYPQDTKGTPSGAMAAAEALFADGVDIIVGPLLAPSIRAVAPLAQERGIKVLGLSNDRQVAGDGVYLMGFMPEAEVFRIIDYAALQGLKTFAALVPRTPYGERVGDAFVAEVLNNGGQVTDFDSYPPDAVQLFEPVKRLAHYEERKAELDAERRFLDALGEDDFAEEILKELDKIDTLGHVDYEAILLPEGAALLRTLAPLLPYYDVDPERVKFLGTGLWHDETLIREPQLIGGWFAAPSPEQAKKFEARYRQRFGQNPPRIATLAYDAVALVATLSSGLPVPDFSDAALTDINGFIGMDGLFRFHQSGVVERKLAVLEVTRRGFRVLSPAPLSFVPLLDLEISPPDSFRAFLLPDLPVRDPSADQAGDQAVEDGTSPISGFDGAGDAFNEIKFDEVGKSGPINEPVDGGPDPLFE